MVTYSDLSNIRSENSRLQSDINTLDRKVTQVENENEQLRMEINTMAAAISNARQTLSNSIERTVNGLEIDRNSVTNSNNLLVNAYNIQGQTEVNYALYKNIEEAYKNIRRLNNKIKYEMANHDKIKKLAYAVIDNLNSHMVSMENLRKETEKTHLKSGNTDRSTADFWLAFALLHIFQIDAKEFSAAERSLEEAKKLNATSTYIYLFLYYMCAKDYQSALKYFDMIPDKKSLFNIEKFMLFFFLVKTTKEYKTGYEPLDNRLVALWDEFFGQDTVDEEQILNKILEWYYTNTVCRYYKKENLLPGEEQPKFKDVMAEPGRLINNVTSKGELYKRTKEHIAEYSNMMVSLAFASENERIKDLLEIYENGELKNYYGNFITYMVDDFVAEASTKKLDAIKKEIEENEAIIICKGDKAKAQTYLFQKRSEARHNSQVDYMYNWLNDNNKENEYVMQDRVKKAAFVALKSYYLRAYERYRENYFRILPSLYNVAIGEFTIQTDFKDQERDEKEVKKFYNRKSKELKAAIKKWQIVVFPIFSAVLEIGRASCRERV